MKLILLGEMREDSDKKPALDCNDNHDIRLNLKLVISARAPKSVRGRSRNSQAGHFSSRSS